MKFEVGPGPGVEMAKRGRKAAGAKAQTAFWPSNSGFLNENNDPTNRPYHFVADHPTGAAFLVPEGRSD
jgi:hypothetical protein